ncbi:AMP-dependent synthetase and ligase [Neobacillus bataviensis LMG 21833]|uniref:AMP-dependent synthetase and ligase n=1 Tax=Neobacillus bataviensis LMG 21833 TaxID=1117379 RepID=K6CHP1_9BACI|nr:AMP-binding protein [Neobacillus bataviensis]EKN70650.1 AMP-dependent synthetase and ligase [Neobacillus bataviensis LMG 21833]
MFEEITKVNRVAIGDIIRRAASRYKDKTALVEEDKIISYEELDHGANRFANYLIEIGFKKGETIATICSNSIDFVIAMFGIQKAGLIWVPINPGISISEKNYILTKVAAKMIIADYNFVQHNISEFEEYPVIIIGQKTQMIGKPFSETLIGQSDEEPDVPIQDRDVAQIMFTSGTTGNPKGIKISHLAVYFASLSNIIEFNFKASDVAAALMPMFHCAQHTFLASFLNVGARIVIIKKFEPENFMHLIEQEEITFMFALPMMYRAIIHHSKQKSYHLDSLQTCMYAMAPMDRNTLEKGINEIGANFLLGTGQTEIYPATMQFKPEEQLRRFGSYWGTTAIINDTAVMDENGNILPKGQIGEIVHRGPNVMNGYLNDEKATIETRLFGWHHTGDLGYWDEDGQMVFVDRKKDIIKTGGENVASIKVEQTLLNHEKIENAVVVGLPHDRWIEAVTAFVIPKADSDVIEEEIITYCKQHLGGFQVPKKIIFIDEFPMTTTGKIQKHKLRKQFESLYSLEHPENIH